MRRLPLLILSLCGGLTLGCGYQVRPPVSGVSGVSVGQIEDRTSDGLLGVLATQALGEVVRSEPGDTLRLEGSISAPDLTRLAVDGTTALSLCAVSVHVWLVDAEDEVVWDGGVVQRSAHCARVGTLSNDPGPSRRAARRRALREALEEVVERVVSRQEEAR